MTMDVPEEELQELYTWVDAIPLSRPKRSIARDFADGVLVAELVAHHVPRAVELHNYSAASSLAAKMYNWNTLNQKVFRKIGLTGVSKADYEPICNCEPGAIERFLKLLRTKLAKYQQRKSAPSSPQPPQRPPTAAARAPAVPAPVAHRPETAPALASYPPQAAAAALERGAEGFAERLALAARAVAERDAANSELQKINEILEEKVRKLEKLVRVKDVKIQTLSAKLQTLEAADRSPAAYR